MLSLVVVSFQATAAFAGKCPHALSYPCSSGTDIVTVGTTSEGEGSLCAIGQLQPRGCPYQPCWGGLSVRCCGRSSRRAQGESCPQLGSRAQHGDLGTQGCCRSLLWGRPLRRASPPKSAQAGTRLLSRLKQRPGP